MRHFEGTHDLSLPEWGPYTKSYLGVSHVADQGKGIRFDLSVFPGFYRRKVDVPNVLWESGYHPWEAAPDLSYFTHRHELEWKDKVYTDISFSELSEKSRLIRCECVNNTDLPQNIVLHYMASLHFPQVQSHGAVLQEAEVHLPEAGGAIWVDALDYEELEFAVPRPSDGLVYDGFHRGEARIQQFVKGSGLATGFASNRGDRVVYPVAVNQDMAAAAITFRYKLEEGAAVDLRVEGLLNGSISLEGTGQISELSMSVGRLTAGSYRLSLLSEGGAALELDGFIVAEAWQLPDVRFELLPRNPVPSLEQGPCSNSLLLHYEGLDHVYGIVWGEQQAEVRQFYASELDRFMRFKVHEHVQKVLSDGKEESHFTNVFLRPISLPPSSSQVLHGMVCCGTKEEVQLMLAEFDRIDATSMEGRYRSVVSKSGVPVGTPAGEPYRFSQRLMAATLATNVVFPVYTKRSYIRHYTPGRWWDSLYTWDSGFIGLGLSELDPELAAACLNAYVTEPGDPYTAFIHHGSMVPVQHYLFHELWNKTQSQEWLEHFYSRLKQYYEFYTGKAGGSTTNTLQSKLLKTWDYFYNSGGWDDYPPQVQVHREKMAGFVAPVSNTCHAIRIAKILSFAAAQLGGLEEDIQRYKDDIALFAEAVNKHAWDSEAGYYGYVVHNEQGEPVGLLRHESGANYNMGLDGTYPLVAGVSSADRGRRMLAHLVDAERIWSPIGLSTVDRTAPYFTNDGYWNGAVWMPHQWFYWKTMLDLGQADFAWQIASTALELWRKETGETYNCYEHFIVESGRGAGWHQFGGLSAPVLLWFAAYYRPGRVTVGHDVWIERQLWNDGHTSLELEFRHMANAMDSEYTVIVCMNPSREYEAISESDGLTGVKARLDGLLELTFNGGMDRAHVSVRAN